MKAYTCPSCLRKQSTYIKTEMRERTITSIYSIEHPYPNNKLKETTEEETIQGDITCPYCSHELPIYSLPLK